MAKVGRPTKYPRSKKKQAELCQALIDHGRSGLSFETFGVSDTAVELLGGYTVKDTLYRWIKKYPEFSDAKKAFTELSRQFWEKIANDHLTHYRDGKQLNSAVWIFNMRNRFGWRDKPEDQEQAPTDVNVNIKFSKKTEADVDE